MTGMSQGRDAARRATIADVAQAAGVSPSTASVVFSGKAPVADSTRERVLAVAAELGYAGPDPRAASLRRGRSGIVAVVLEGHLRTAFLDPVTTAMMDGVTDGLAGLGAGVLLLRDDTDAVAGAPTLASVPVDAVVLIGCSGRLHEDLDAVRARGVPAVVIEGDAGEGVPRIDLDNREAAAQLARHLRGLGHERVDVVTLPFDASRLRGLASPERIAAITVDVTRKRLDGVREEYPDARVVSAGGSSIDEGMIAGRTLLEQAEDRPTAIMAQSDLLAAGVIRAAEERGLRVPEDLSVTGFDGVVVDGLGDHVLTTVVQPAVGKGRAAGAAVARLLAGEQVESIVFTCRFREGTTTCAPSHGRASAP
ncbi:substrate-binding domain-containing protein [Microbacterium pseudoresistens]|uniref:DNA-binding LacI/PurR family transcriptional regulator n=1 Tax=Microbacterium pseudoresistens TaxID=640634 RepID=A0A7Y9JLR7_9MICO|nr:LacI family DNA-binding transcriptional regulator [Microbacterium pseudoresistens]NYD54007.1 DNA-binding LacI/PurR family transcriptional regulator [Microbacterium pseudoresistens]